MEKQELELSSVEEAHRAESTSRRGKDKPHWKGKMGQELLEA